MDLTTNLTSRWIHGGSPLDALATVDIVAQLRKAMEEGPLFQNLIKTHLLENQHRLTLTMIPGSSCTLVRGYHLMYIDSGYAQQKIEREKVKVAGIEAELTQGQKDEIVRRAIELKERQEEFQGMLYGCV